MQFKLYTAVTGGTLIWSETRTAANANAVTITNGLFSVLIGEGTAVAGSSATLQAAVTANASMYMEVMVGSETLTPRSQFGASAYAINADMIDGIDGASLAQLSGTNSWTAAQTVNVASTGAFAVTNGGTNLFKADTTNSQVIIGTSDTTAALLVLDTKTSTGDPTAVAGAMYYNSNSGKLRCAQGAAWVDCVSSPTLQNVYDNSSTPATITTSAAGKGIAIAAGAVPTTDLLSITNTGQGVTTAGVNGLSVNYVGGAAAVEASGMRVDLTPGTTSGGTWNGLRVVANSTGAVSGVSEYGINLDGPITPGSGLEAALTIDANWDAGIQIEGRSSEPPVPTGSNIYVYAQKYAGRTILAQKGASGVAVGYQPALFEQSVTLVTPGNGTTINSIGTTPIVDTTVSTPAATEAYGYNMNFVTTTTSGDTSGISGNSNQAQYYRGGTTNGSNGFFYVARLGFPDASYGSGSTGARVWTGLTTQVNTTSATPMAQADAPTGSFIGFRYSTNASDTNWMLHTSSGGTPTAASTAMAFAATKTYDFYLYCAPLGTTVYWRIDNLTDGTTQEGSTTTTLPATTTGMRYMTGLGSLGTARNLRVNKIYIETDR